jgi:hypothetical protein
MLGCFSRQVVAVDLVDLAHRMLAHAMHGLNLGSGLTDRRKSCPTPRDSILPSTRLLPFQSALRIDRYGSPAAMRCRRGAMKSLQGRTHHQLEDLKTVKERLCFYQRHFLSQEILCISISCVLCGVQLVHKGVTGNCATFAKPVQRSKLSARFFETFCTHEGRRQARNAPTRLWQTGESLA